MAGVAPGSGASGSGGALSSRSSSRSSGCSAAAPGSARSADIVEGLRSASRIRRAAGSQVVFVIFLFIANFAILFGPLLLMNISQIRGFEPGDAEWGVKLDDVRGQAEAKEEVRRVVSALAVRRGVRARGRQARARPALPRRAGYRQDDAREGDRDRLQLAVRLDPRLRLRATFIGIDAIVVRYVAWKAKRLARKWGGQCIVFIDEIDAVGMRRQALGGGARRRRRRRTPRRASRSTSSSARTARSTRSGDLILETRAWRERLFAERGAARAGRCQGSRRGSARCSTSCSRAWAVAAARSR